MSIQCSNITAWIHLIPTLIYHLAMFLLSPAQRKRVTLQSGDLQSVSVTALSKHWRTWDVRQNDIFCCQDLWELWEGANDLITSSGTKKINKGAIEKNRLGCSNKSCFSNTKTTTRTGWRGLISQKRFENESTAVTPRCLDVSAPALPVVVNLPVPARA